MFLINSVGLVSGCFTLLCFVMWWWCGQAAVFTGYTTPQWSYCDGHLAFRSLVPTLYIVCPRPAPFFPPTLHCWWSPPYQALAPHPTTSTAWHHVNHGRHPFSQRSPRSLLSGSACPEVLGKLMQIQENLAHRLLLPNLWTLWTQCWHTNTQSFGWKDNWLNEVQFR